MVHVLVYYTLLVVVIICIIFVKLRKNVGECCKPQLVWVHQRIAPYKMYLLLLLLFILILLLLYVFQACEVYLAGFQFVVLNNAFVLHDGFKRRGSNGNYPGRKNEYRRNSGLNKQFLKHMAVKYRGSNKTCTD